MANNPILRFTGTWGDYVGGRAPVMNLALEFPLRGTQVSSGFGFFLSERTSAGPEHSWSCLVAVESSV